MSYNKPVRRIAIVGTGVIGASWAAEYLACGFDVVATDPAPNAETPLGTYQGMTDQIVMSRTSFRTVLVPRGASKPEWLAH